MRDYISAKKREEFKSGKSIDCYKFLGCRRYKKESADGFLFSVWAPSARSIRVVGDFNDWGRRDPLSGYMDRDDDGIWHFFTTEVEEGQYYKYLVEHQNLTRVLKSDPYSRCSEFRPGTASVVYDQKPYRWHDKKWMDARKEKDHFHTPMNIYEVHLGSWRRETNDNPSQAAFLNYRTIADELANYVKEMNYTHVEIMPISEHPFDGSWGYQTLCYYSITSRFGTPDDFRYFVDKMHKEGISVILDWVPAHFCKDESGLYNFDGNWAYEPTDANYRENILWGTANFDYGKGEVMSFLISNAMYFLKEFHVDGLRVDAVANMIYIDYERIVQADLRNVFGGKDKLEGINFLKELNKSVFSNVENPIMIAEDSSAWPDVTKPVEAGGLGFSFKWCMGWMNDTLKYVGIDPIYRKYHHNLMNFSMMYIFKENFILPLSHDEVVHGKKTIIDKMFGDYDTKFDALRLYYLFMITHPGKKLSFMGNEFAPFMEWRFYEELEWKMLNFPKHLSIQEYVKALNAFYLENKALWEVDDDYSGFRWINADDSDFSVLSYIRYSKNEDDFLVVVCNFTPVEHHNFTIGVPADADYRKVFASKGENGLSTLCMAEKNECNGFPFSIKFNLPGYGAVVYKPIFRSKEEK